MLHSRHLAAAIGAFGLFLASDAAAHAKLVSSTPAANATVAAPQAITLTFNERLTSAASGFDLEMVGHKMKVAVKTTVSKDGLSITGAPQGKLMAGAYKITWRAAGADGHPMTGDILFKVN